ncbi:uncharacterized protein KZ484_010541 [Pholidichthys leucotaenia]
MAAQGCSRTAKQCWEKLKKMKSDYRAIKDHNGRSGVNRKDWKWFNQMDAIYGHRLASNGREIGVDTAKPLLETVDESVSTCQGSASLSMNPPDCPASVGAPESEPTPMPAASPAPSTSGTTRSSADFPQKLECKEEEVLADQQLWNQERNFVLDEEKPEPPQLKEEHEEPEPPQVKEEQEEFCICQEGEQLVVKLEVNTIMVTLVSEEKQQSEVEPNSEQLLSHNSAGTEIQDERGSRHVDSGSTKEEEPKPKKRRLKTGNQSNGDDDSLTSKSLCEIETGKKLFRLSL